MKKTLLAALLACLAVAPSKAALFWGDIITNYPLGCITTNTTPGYATNQWLSHLPGSGVDAIVISNNFNNPVAVSGRRLSLFTSGSEYVHRWFDPVATNGYLTGTLYVSFVVAVNSLPTAGGTYFAHFMDGGSPLGTNAFEFRGHVYAVQNTNSFPFTNTIPNTFRLGTANANGDTAQGAGPDAILPIDLALNTDYQVVMRYDIDSASATIWVNPATESDVANATPYTGLVGVTDFGPITNALAAFAFRQRTGIGRELIRNILVGTSFSDVVTNTPAIPLIGLQPAANTTNYAGNPALLEVCASGMGELNYTWYQITAGPLTNQVQTGTSQQLYFSSLSALNAGQYFCTISNTAGSTNTALANLVVNSTPTAPFFTAQQGSLTTSVGGNQSLSCAASGTGPLTYQWNFNGTPFPSDGANPFGFSGDSVVVSGSQTPTLLLTGVSTNEGGSYTLTVTGGVPPAITSSNAVLTVNPPKVVTIAYLRSLLNTNTWQAGDTGDTFTISNAVVTTWTNVTSGSTASYYIQDASGCGIDLFVTGDPTFRPQLGQLVSATGTLSSFDNALELDVNSQNPYQNYAVSDSDIHLLPAPAVFSLPLTNNLALMETNWEGKLAMLTNVWFTNVSLAIGGSSITDVISNAANMRFNIFFPSSEDKAIANTNIPGRFAYTITGVLTKFSTANPGTIAGYEMYVTRLGDIVTNPPPPVTASIALSGANVLLSWAAVPYSAATLGAYSYSVMASTNVTGPYLPVATGLTFNTTNGTYTDTLSGSVKFYQVNSP
jgi:hypothetical protein